MGIQDLNSVITKHAEDAYATCPLSMFASRRIAIDGNFFLMAKYKTAYAAALAVTDLNVTIDEPDFVDRTVVRAKFLDGIFSTLIEMMKAWILPVLIFDGRPPEDKRGTLDQRKALRVKQQQEIDAIVDTYRNGSGFLDVSKLQKKLKEASPVNQEDMDLVKTVISNMGIPCLQALSEGEQLCAMLSIEGSVAAVWSTDTDTLTYGCPLLITSFSKQTMNGEKCLMCVRLDKVLEGFNTPFSTFVDFCIMLGCDYNKRIPKVGPAKIKSLLVDGNSIDELEDKFQDPCLRHQRCRQLFQYIPSEQLVVNEYNLNVRLDTIEEAREMSRLVGAEGKFNLIYPHLQRMAKIEIKEGVLPGLQAFWSSSD